MAVTPLPPAAGDVARCCAAQLAVAQAGMRDHSSDDRAVARMVPPAAPTARLR
jgi:hypothetical protein